MIATTDSSRNDYVNVLETKFNERWTVSFEKIRRKNCASEDASTKSSKFTNKCLFVITAIQSLLPAMAITLTYFKCSEVEERLAHFSKFKGFENANCSFLENYIKAIKHETHSMIR